MLLCTIIPFVQWGAVSPYSSADGSSIKEGLLLGTIFEGIRLPLLKWFEALDLFLLHGGISAIRLSQMIGVTTSHLQTYLLLLNLSSSLLPYQTG
ncbi:hypothetical protein [Paenibacillus sp. TH7-28]